MNYEKQALLFKALSDSSRLQIVDMLSCGEMCACEILEHFKVTQPTLSHHMRVLCDVNIVKARKQGLWMYYSLNGYYLKEFMGFMQNIISNKDNCICKKENNKSSIGGK